MSTSPSVENPQAETPQKKSFWTPAKIAVLIVVILVAAGGTGYGLSKVGNPSPTPPLPPDFSFSSSQPTNTQAGSSSQATLTITGRNGFNSGVSFSFSPPAGLSCSSPSPSGTFVSTAQYSCSSDSAGSYLLTITGTGGSTSHSITVQFVFGQPGSVPVSGAATVTGAAATSIDFSVCGFDPSAPGYNVCELSCATGPDAYCGASATVSSNGYYSLSLRNPGSYAVRIDTGASSCLAGSLVLNQNSVAVVSEGFSCSVVKSTSTNIVCDLSTVVVNLTFTTCTVTVMDTSSASVPVTGSVTVTSPNRWWANPISCQTTSSEVCKLTGVGAIVRPPSGILTLTASYAGDSVHASSSGQIDLIVNNPPPTVTVSGTVSAQAGCIGCSVTSMNFIASATGLTYSTVPSNGDYTITIPNLQQYTVVINWSGTFGSGSCTRYLTLDQATSSLTVNFQC